MKKLILTALLGISLIGYTQAETVLIRNLTPDTGVMKVDYVVLQHGGHGRLMESYTPVHVKLSQQDQKVQVMALQNPHLPFRHHFYKFPLKKLPKNACSWVRGSGKPKLITLSLTKHDLKCTPI